MDSLSTWQIVCTDTFLKMKTENFYLMHKRICNLKKLYKYVYIRPLNNRGLNSGVHLYADCFSISITVPHNPHLVESADA